MAGGGGGEGAGEVSDSSKICMQLCLDVAAYAEELRKIGVQPSELEAFMLQDKCDRRADAGRGCERAGGRRSLMDSR